MKEATQKIQSVQLGEHQFGQTCNLHYADVDIDTLDRYVWDYCVKNQNRILSLKYDSREQVMRDYNSL